ncbi:MAG: hypothetical protein CTY15_04695 [Methylocystis sp.]|nr:MAG: hypothetical protein CTY15_04695 [Methylocystis sp.]
MEPLFAPAAAAAASFNFQFLAFLVLGALVATLIARPRALSEGFVALAVVGVSGAWLGAEIAHLFGQADRGGTHQFAAALIGAAILSVAWRRLHPAEPLQRGDPARR